MAEKKLRPFGLAAAAESDINLNIAVSKYNTINQPKYPIKVTKQSTPTNARTTRGVTAGKLIEIGSLNSP